MRYMALVLILIAAGAVLAGCARDDAESIPYESDFVELVKAGNIDHVQIMSEPSGLIRITGWTKPDSSPGRKFKVEVVNSYNSVAELLRKNGIGYSIAAPQPEQNDLRGLAMLPILISVIWIVVLIGVSIFLLVLALRFVRAVERIADNIER